MLRRPSAGRLVGPSVDWRTHGPCKTSSRRPPAIWPSQTSCLSYILTCAGAGPVGAAFHQLQTNSHVYPGSGLRAAGADTRPTASTARLSRYTAAPRCSAVCMHVCMYVPNADRLINRENAGPASKHLALSTELTRCTYDAIRPGSWQNKPD